MPTGQCLLAVITVHNCLDNAVDRSYTTRRRRRTRARHWASVCLRGTPFECLIHAVLQDLGMRRATSGVLAMQCERVVC